MNVTITPSVLHGSMTAPPSKSMAHRLLICGGLAKGTSIIRGIDASQDVLATLDCLKAIGASYTFENDTVTITGTDLQQLCPAQTLPCRESGSTLRFFIPLCLLGRGEIALTGSEKLLSRPLEVYENLCRERGLGFANDGRRVTVQGPLSSGIFEIPGNISSQFITGLLFALPLLEGDSRLKVTGRLESRSYVELTLAALSHFGITAFWENAQTLLIPGGQTYQNAEATVEGDYSNAAFFDAFNYLGGNVTVTGLKEDSRQGDRVYREYFKALSEGPAVLSLEDCPDLAPILFSLAAAMHGGTFTDTARLRIKESDRGEVMAQELAGFGVPVKVSENRITVTGGCLHAPSGPLDGHNDHRVVMSLAVLCTLCGGTITGAQAVAKSLPDFFERIQTLGAELTVSD